MPRKDIDLDFTDILLFLRIRKEFCFLETQSWIKKFYKIHSIPINEFQIVVLKTNSKLQY